MVEGNTDIRFVTGLCEVCKLTLVVPESNYVSSGLERRVEESGASPEVIKISGGRLAYQWRSWRWLRKNVMYYDVVLTQELLRGTLNASIAGRLQGIPVLANILVPPLEYYRCRRLRGQGWLKSLAGESVIRFLLAVNGRLVTRCLAWGPYLQGVARRHCQRVELGHYYGIDTDLFRPADLAERMELRRKHNLPVDKLLVLSTSRVSHEKDPETALRGISLARSQGVDAVVLNLGGGYEQFVELARKLELPKAEDWVFGRPAQHPMKELADFFRCADALLQSSLEEGLALSTLESLACGTSVIATAVGGMAVTLPGYARLTPRQDHEAIARELLWIAQHPEEAREQALRGREMVLGAWTRKHAFAHWAEQFREFQKKP